MNNNYGYSELEEVSIATTGQFPTNRLWQARYGRNQTLNSEYSYSTTYSNTHNLDLRVVFYLPDTYDVRVIPGIFQSFKIAWTNYVF